MGNMFYCYVSAGKVYYTCIIFSCGQCGWLTTFSYTQVATWKVNIYPAEVKIVISEKLLKIFKCVVCHTMFCEGPLFDPIFLGIKNHRKFIYPLQVSIFRYLFLTVTGAGHCNAIDVFDVLYFANQG